MDALAVVEEDAVLGDRVGHVHRRAFAMALAAQRRNAHHAGGRFWIPRWQDRVAAVAGDALGRLGIIGAVEALVVLLLHIVVAIATGHRGQLFFVG